MTGLASKEQRQFLWEQQGRMRVVGSGCSSQAGVHWQAWSTVNWRALCCGNKTWHARKVARSQAASLCMALGAGVAGVVVTVVDR